MASIIQRLREPPFGTETSERNLFNAAADKIEQLERELAENRSMMVGIANERDAAISARDEALRMFAAEKALADGLWVSFLEYRKRLRRAAYNVVVAADKAEDAYRKARGL